MPHANEVLGELGLAFDPALALRDHEGLEAFALQAAQHFAGGDVAVAVRPADMLASGEDGRRGAAHLVFGQRRVAADDKSVAAKTCGQARRSCGCSEWWCWFA